MKAVQAMRLALLQKNKRQPMRRAAVYALSAAACVALALFCLRVWPGGFEVGDTTPSLSVVIPEKSPLPVTPMPAPTPGGFTATLRINPSVEFHVDEAGMILAVIGVNEDGAALIAGIDFAGMTFENATIVVVNRLIVENYISASCVQDDIFLSVKGGSGEKILECMSSVIRAAAACYDLSVDTVQSGENELQLVLAARPEEPAEGDLPPMEEGELPVSLVVEYVITGKQYPYSEVEELFVTLENGERYPSWKVLHCDIAGGSLMHTTLWAMISLMEKGYVSDGLQGQILFQMKACTQRQLEDVLTLISLILEDGMLHLKAEIADADSLRIVPADALASDVPSRYTLAELMDVMLVKEKADITQRQLDMIHMAYPEHPEDYLEPRYWAVVPNFEGLTEEEAVGLCRLAGFAPEVYYVPFDPAISHSEDIGRVIYQDTNTGNMWEVGSRFFLQIQSADPNPTPS